jgi:hypothetical protein
MNDYLGQGLSVGELHRDYGTRLSSAERFARAHEKQQALARYRFFLFDLKRVSIGAPISLGWPYAPQAKIPTKFRFEPNDGPPSV